MAARNDIPISFLRECFDCDPATGSLRWRERPRSHFPHEGRWRYFNRRYANTESGSRDANGYRVVSLTFEGKLARYYQHHIVWALTKDEWPKNLDHYDGDTANNRIDNLFEADHSENDQNLDRRIAGATFRPHKHRWYARIKIDGKLIHLGAYKTKEEAHQAYLDAKKKYHLHRPIPRNN